MKILDHLSIRTRLYFSTIFSLVLLTAIGLTGYASLHVTVDTLRTLLERKVEVVMQANELRTGIAQVRRIEKSMIINFNNTNTVAGLRAGWAEALADINKKLEAMRRNQAGEAAQVQLITQAMDGLKQYQTGFAPVADQIERAQIDGAAAGAYADGLENHVATADKLLGDLSSGLRTDMKKSQADLEHMAKTMSAVLAASIVIALLVLIPLTVLTVRSISRSLTQARDLAARIASGDLSNEIAAKGRDEMAQLVMAMGEMQTSLRNMVHQVRAGTDTMATASSQIAAGNLDLSSRTEQQASSLEETASSMEELTSTVKQNADNARQANQLAMTASDVAVKGGAVVSQVVSTMGSINDSSRKIVDIISVIDGIAFQTNILALNAAVEAARAGEQGRGFAVVATEVRSLAQRSAAAAKEIKALIGDSVDKVNVGSKLVGEAGATMDEVVASVKRVTDIMGEITAASQEQSAGIEQVNQAIAQMDQVTQQNAALVEEAAAAAESLQDQASELANVVSVFKLGMNEQTTAVRSTPARQSMQVKRLPPKSQPKSQPQLESAGKSQRNPMRMGKQESLRK